MRTKGREKGEGSNRKKQKKKNSHSAGNPEGESARNKVEMRRGKSRKVKK